MKVGLLIGLILYAVILFGIICWAEAVPWKAAVASVVWTAIPPLLSLYGGSKNQEKK